MGLFNRNKGDSPAPASPEGATQPADTGTFDFDAISRDLDAQNGASSFDSLLATPATNAQQPANGGDSAFDFPENDPLGLSTPPSPTPAAGLAPTPASPEAVINAPLTPTPIPPAPTTSEATAITPPRAPTNVPKAKKPLPLVPLLGALGLLAVAGGGAMFLLNSNQETEPTIPQAPPPRMGQAPPRPAGGPEAPVAPGAAVAPGAPGGAAAPGTTSGSGGPGATGTGLRSASPGIAPPPAPKQPIGAASGSSQAAVSIGQSQAPKGPSATAGLDPQMASKLKALWRAGADAKHRKDFKAARAAWGEALRLRPNHPGFQDAINKLPR